MASSVDLGKALGVPSSYSLMRPARPDPMCGASTTGECPRGSTEGPRRMLRPSTPRSARVFSPTPKTENNALNIKRLAVIITAGAMALSLAAPVGAASPNGKADGKSHGKDNLPGVLAQKQTALKQKALEKVAKGQAKATGTNKVVQVAKGQFVELAQT